MTQTQSDDLVTRLRAALVETGREAGALLADDVSSDFLMYVPGEVRGRLIKQQNKLDEAAAEIQRLQAQVAVAREALRPFARQNPHKREEGCAGILVPATISNVRDARAALASIEGAAG